MLSYCFAFFTAVLILEYGDCVTEEVFLNSFKACGEMFEVTLDKDYIVKPNVTPKTKTHSFRDCEVTFHSKHKDGHICLMQTGNVGVIRDNNAQLEATDGLGDNDDPKISILKPAPDMWTEREHCSESEYITLYLKEIRKEMGADINEVDIEFKVVDIESEERELYLDGTYCYNTYYLLHSMVTLWNRPQYPGMEVSRLTYECALRFDKMDKTNYNTSICFAYVPSGTVNCEVQWRFVVSLASYDNALDERYTKYSLRCNETRASDEIHVWCAEPSVEFVTVIYRRADNLLSNSSLEPPQMFSYVVGDHEGTEESFLLEVKAMLGTSTTLSGLPWTYIVYTVGAVTFIFILIVVCIVFRRRHYQRVKSDDRAKVV